MKRKQRIIKVVKTQIKCELMMKKNVECLERTQMREEYLQPKKRRSERKRTHYSFLHVLLAMSMDTVQWKGVGHTIENCERTFTIG